MKFGVITLFPELLDCLKSRAHFGLIGKAFQEGAVELFVEDLRSFGLGRHKEVDDTPYGGGDGMVLRPEPIQKALNSVLEQMKLQREDVLAIYTCPRGDLWTQRRAETYLSHYKGVIILCGRYAGADERVVDECFDVRLSMGPFVLNGGELPALTMIETMVRLVPGVLGNPESVQLDSFSAGCSGLESESYTKPQVWSGKGVPEVLLSGHHKLIKEYRESRAQELSQDWLKRAQQALEDSMGEN